MPHISYFLFPILGYLCGSLTFSIWVTHFVKGVDVRDSGSGHATTTNTIRQAGFGWGALVLALDIAKGFIPTYLAVREVSTPVYIIAITATCAVIGHCWPLFARFRGGMGLATAGGTFLAVNSLVFLISLGLLILLVLVIRHSARASVLTGILIAPALWILNIRDAAFWVTVGAGVVIAIRFLTDWNRQYRELWLDREQTGRISE
ncbi:MAG: glycerol-3-phosphate acyltransferase [Anaerolineales bacterium]|nr:glycerol-3-phosphate acyltransferase [Anaerolineales bacterium]MBK8822309.1 glycerol-3-phosphate acyltransferase [Anaerolineales bacterium]